eukprot:1091683-Amphidinium_carterae.1
MVELLLDRQVNVDVRNYQLRSALHYAAKKDKSGDIVKMLLRERAQCDLQDRDGQTALCDAVQTSNIEAVRHLLNARASVERAFVGGNVLNIACRELFELDGQRQQNVCKLLFAADLAYFEASREKLMEQAAEESQTD